MFIKQTMNDKPFIQLYTSPRGYYFYEVNKDTIVSISESIYNYLDGVISYDDLDSDNRKYLQNLKENGYLSTKRYSKIRHPETNNLRYYIENKCNQLILQVTQACNLVCYYCAYANKSDDLLQRDHTNKMMTWEVAKASIDFFYEHSKDTESVAIGFYGGEPLIAFDLIKKCVSYIEELFIGRSYSLNMTTNATLFTDEIIDYLLEHNFDLAFSIDGPESIHDINRRRSDGTGSFNVAFQNLKKVAERYGKDAEKHVMINMVLNPENDLDEVLSLFNDPFFEEYKIITMGSRADEDYLEKKLKVKDDYNWKITYQYFLALLDYLKLVDDLSIPAFIKLETVQLTKKYSSYRTVGGGLADVGAPGGPCIPGQQRLFVDSDGTLYPCEKVSETSDCMKIGNVFDGFDYDKAAAILNIANITEEKCKNCYATLHCQLCAKCADAGDTFSAEKRLQNCKNTYSFLDDEIKSCILIKENRTKYKWRG